MICLRLNVRIPFSTKCKNRNSGMKTNFADLTLTFWISNYAEYRYIKKLHRDTPKKSFNAPYRLRFFMLVLKYLLISFCVISSSQCSSRTTISCHKKPLSPNCVYPHNHSKQKHIHMFISCSLRTMTLQRPFSFVSMCLYKANGSRLRIRIFVRANICMCVCMAIEYDSHLLFKLLSQFACVEIECTACVLLVDA